MGAAHCRSGYFLHRCVAAVVFLSFPDWPTAVTLARPAAELRNRIPVTVWTGFAMMRVGRFVAPCPWSGTSLRYSSRPGLEHIGARSDLRIGAAQSAVWNTCCTPDLAYQTGRHL